MQGNKLFKKTKVLGRRPSPCLKMQQVCYLPMAWDLDHNISRHIHIPVALPVLYQRTSRFQFSMDFPTVSSVVMWRNCIRLDIWETMHLKENQALFFSTTWDNTHFRHVPIDTFAINFIKLNMQLSTHLITLLLISRKSVWHFALLSLPFLIYISPTIVNWSTFVIAVPRY